MLVDGNPEFSSEDAITGIKAAYDRGETDEFVSPTTLNAFHPIQDGDGVIFFNFRSDRGVDSKGTGSITGNATGLANFRKASIVAMVCQNHRQARRSTLSHFHLWDIRNFPAW